MHKPESVLENQAHKFLWDFEIQIDDLIPTWRPDLVIINKKKRICRILDFAALVDHRVKTKESELKNVKEHEIDGDTKYNWYARNGSKGNGKGTVRTGNQKTFRDYSNSSISKIGQNAH